MEKTQSIIPQMMSAAQQPKVAGGIFGVRSPRNPVVEMPAGVLGLQIQSNDNPAKLDDEGNFEAPRVKKQCAGLW